MSRDTEKSVSKQNYSRGRKDESTLLTCQTELQKPPVWHLWRNCFCRKMHTMESCVIQSNVSEKISKVPRETKIMKSYLQYEKKTATQLCSYEFVKFSLKLFKKHLWTAVCVSNTRLYQMIWFTVSTVQPICSQCTLSLTTFSLQHFQGVKKRCIRSKLFNTRAKWRISLLLQ